MARKQLSMRRVKLCRTRSWRRSNQALSLLFLLLVPMPVLSMERPEEAFSSSISPSIHQEPTFNISDINPDEQQATASLVAQANMFTQRVGRSFSSEKKELPKELVESCKQNMPPLLQGIYAYLQSPDSINPDKQIRSFHRFLLIGPPGTSKSTTPQAIAQDLGIGHDICEASSLIGKYRGHTAINIRTMLEELMQKKGRYMYIINEMHKLLEGHANNHTDHSENAHTLWCGLDQLEKNHPNIILALIASNFK